MRWRCGFVVLSPVWVLASVLSATSHDEWANGQPVPAWIKAACCGPADAHRLRPDQVHDMGEYYQVDGYSKQIAKFMLVDGHRVPAYNVIPSQDGSYWLFYRDQITGGQSDPFCFFVPMDF